MNQLTFLNDAEQEPHDSPAMVRPIAVTPEDEHEFLAAVEAYKQQSGRLFPTWCEILEILHSLGYAKRIWKPVGAWSPYVAVEFRDGQRSSGYFDSAEVSFGS